MVFARKVNERSNQKPMRLLTNVKMNTTKTFKFNKFSAFINGILPSIFVQPLPHYPEKRERKVRWKKELVEVRLYKPDASIKYFPTSNLVQPLPQDSEKRERKVRWKKDLVEVRFYSVFIEDITCDIDVEMVDCFDEITCDIDVEMVDCFDETSTNMDTSISKVDYHQKPRRRPITRSLSKRTRSGKLY